MINYTILDKSIKHYSSGLMEFKRVEVPWNVTPYIDSLTRPEDCIELNISPINRNLVASGEQGFLEMYLKGNLPLGKFQTITPCFRQEELDLTHRSQFIKNELIFTDLTDSKVDLEALVDVAWTFFGSLFPSEDLAVVDTPEGFDIEYKGEELGSYGIRECDFLKWIYGTGCAEPRTSTLIKKYGISQPGI